MKNAYASPNNKTSVMLNAMMCVYVTYFFIKFNVIKAAGNNEYKIGGQSSCFDHVLIVIIISVGKKGLSK